MIVTRVVLYSSHRRRRAAGASTRHDKTIATLFFSFFYLLYFICVTLWRFMCVLSFAFRIEADNKTEEKEIKRNNAQRAHMLRITTYQFTVHCDHTNSTHTIPSA